MINIASLIGGETNNMDEPALISSALTGNLDAFNQLILAYQNLLFRQALYLLDDSDEAEDAVQEALIAAYQHLASFRGGSVRAWLLRIVTNTCYDALRLRKRRPTIPLEPLNQDQEEIETALWMIDPADLPEKWVEQKELSQYVREGLAQIEPAYRMAVFLVDLQGLDYTEAAKVAKIPLGTLKSRLARGRAQLHHVLMTETNRLPLQQYNFSN